MSSDFVKPNIVDRVIGFFDPKAAGQRLLYRSQYHAAVAHKGASRSRRATKKWRPGEGSPDSDNLPEVGDLRGRSRDLVRNMPLAGGAVTTTTTHTVGVGLVPHATLDREVLGLSEEAAAQWEREAERQFRLATKCVDLRETMDFSGFQELAFRSALESGDFFTVRRWRDRPGQKYGLRLQGLEADRVSNPRGRTDDAHLAGGIEVDADGRPIIAHVTNHHPGDIRQARALEWTAIPFRYDDQRPVILHLVERTREGQTRGVPFLAPVIEALRGLEEYSDAELRAASVSALFTVFLESDASSGTTLVDALSDSGETSGLEADEMELGAGAIIGLNPGDKASMADPSRPNPQFDGFVMAVLRQIGVGLELPFELLIKHFTASYSASRAALELAQMGFNRRRRWFVRGLCQPVWEMVIEEAVARGYLEAPGFFTDPVVRAAWLGCEWIGPRRISLDPLKDAKADREDMEAGAKTLQQVCSERTGGDWERKLEQAAKENRKRQDLGLDAPGPRLPSPEEDKDEDKDA